MGTLVASGQISLAGTTPNIPLNSSIQVALNGTGSTQISLNDTGVIALRGFTGAPISTDQFYSKISPTCKAIFGFGNTVIGITGTPTAVTNLVSTAGVVATDTAGVGTARNNIAACTYGYDKGIAGFGYSTAVTGVTNLISNAGVVATDVAAVGTARQGVCAFRYQNQLGYFFGGLTTVAVNTQNLVNSSGVVSTNTAAAGTARYGPAAVSYGFDKGVVYGGSSATTGGTYYNISNLVSNAGVMAADVTAAGTARSFSGSCSYNYDKGIFQGGNFSGTVAGTSNLVSNAGVVAANVTAVSNSVFFGRAGSSFGFVGQGIIAYGNSGTAVTNFASTISNTGVVATGAAVSGTARQRLAACGYAVQQQ